MQATLLVNPNAGNIEELQGRNKGQSHQDESGYEDERAIPIATSQAKEWAENRGKEVMKKAKSTQQRAKER